MMKRFIFLGGVFIFAVISLEKGCCSKLQCQEIAGIITADALAGEPLVIPKVIILEIKGMSCRSCVKPIRSALLKVKGVKEAKVDFEQGEAVVLIGNGKVKEEELIKAVKEAGNIMNSYTAKVIKMEVL